MFLLKSNSSFKFYRCPRTKSNYKETEVIPLIDSNYNWQLHQWFHDQEPALQKLKSCSETMQQIYMRTPMPKSDFNKVAKLQISGDPLLLRIYITLIKTTLNHKMIISIWRIQPWNDTTAYKKRKPSTWIIS